MTQTITHKTLKNVSYSMLNYGWPIIIAIFITPIIVAKLGIKEYGIYIFISTLMGLAGILDIGVSTALNKFFAERYSKGDYAGMSRLFKTGNSLMMLTGSIGLIGITSSLYLGQIFWPDQALQYMTYLPSFICAGILFLVNVMMTLYFIVPNAMQRIDIEAKIGIGFFTLQQTAILFVVLSNYGVNEIYVSLTVLTLCFFLWYRRRIASFLPTECKEAIHQFGWDKEEIIKSYRFGIGNFINNIARTSISSLDRVVLPLFVGPSNLTYYSLPGSIAMKTPGLSTAIANIILPMTAGFESVGERSRTKTLYIRSLRLITIPSVAITITILAFPYKMLQYWISSDVADKATATLVILACTNCLLALIGPLNNFFLGLGKLKALTMASVSTAILNAILLFVLLPTKGIEGAAWAYLISLSPYVVLFYWTEYKFLSIERRTEYYIKLIAKLTIVSIIVFLLDQIFISPYIYNFASVIVACMISGAIFMGLYFIFGFFEKEDVRDIRTFINTAIARIKG